MTYSKEQYDDDLSALQTGFKSSRNNTKWEYDDVYAYLEILRQRLENFKSYTTAPAESAKYDA